MHSWVPLIHTDRHLQTYLSNPQPSPTSCLCSELEWLVFHFGLPGALLHSLAWPVYHYWSLSLTWTNRGPFSKVVSQVAVTGVSGTAGARGLDSGTQGFHEKSAGTRARLHHTFGHGPFDKRNALFRKGCLSVLFLIKAGLMRPDRRGNRTHPSCTLYPICTLFNIRLNDSSTTLLKPYNPPYVKPSQAKKHN